MVTSGALLCINMLSVWLLLIIYVPIKLFWLLVIYCFVYVVYAILGYIFLYTISIYVFKIHSYHVLMFSLCPLSVMLDYLVVCWLIALQWSECSLLIVMLFTVSGHICRLFYVCCYCVLNVGFSSVINCLFIVGWMNV
jgi:hypothetical protein